MLFPCAHKRDNLTLHTRRVDSRFAPDTCCYQAWMIELLTFSGRVDLMEVPTGLAVVAPDLQLCMKLTSPQSYGTADYNNLHSVV